MDFAVKKALASGEWVEKTDKSTGKVYYYNKKTKKTTWDLAKELKKEKKSAKSAEKDASSSASVSPTPATSGGGKTLQDVLAEGEWVEKTDKSTGKKYYSNKKTKKTTWDLVKELGLSTATAAAHSASVSPTPEGAKTTATGDGPYRFASVADAVASGEWAEKKDKTSGKKYYSHKATKKTTWDLAKDLAKHQAEFGGSTATATAAGQQGVASQSQRPKKNYDAKVALSNGEWSEVKDYMGQVFYVNNTTKESTGDLALFLKIQEAIDDGEGEVLPLTGYSAAGLNQAGASGKKSKSTAAANSATATEPTTQVKQFDDWVDLMLHAPGHQEAAQRLLKTHRDELEAGIQEEYHQAKTAMEAANRRSHQLEEQLQDSQTIIQRQREEIHQLQCALFYGLNSSHPSSEGSLASKIGLGGATRVNPLPPGVNHHDAMRGNNLQDRVAYMERLITDLQGHNRKLQYDLEQERLAKHTSSDCMHCTRADPWRRLVEVGSPRSFPEQGLSHPQQH